MKNSRNRKTRSRKVIVQIVLGAITTIFANIIFINFLIFLYVLLTGVFPGIRDSLSCSMLFLFLLQVGISQLIYIIPSCLYFKQKKQWGWMKGVIIGAFMTFLLNAGIWIMYSILLQDPTFD
jgi:hypothetical protein